MHSRNNQSLIMWTAAPSRDIGQGSTYLKYILEYLIVCLLADQSGNQQILLNGGSIKLPFKCWIWQELLQFYCQWQLINIQLPMLPTLL
jgi:hypothetical protein